MWSSAVFGRFADPGRLLPPCPGLRGLQETGSDFWTRLLSLEPGDLVPQLLNSFFELPDTIQKLTNHPQQCLDQRRAVLGSNFGKLHLHASQCRQSTRAQLRQFSHFLRGYNSFLIGNEFLKMTSKIAY